MAPFATGDRDDSRMTRRTKQGWMIDLRRHAGLGLVFFALVFVVGLVRVEALALASGDDPLCLAMTGAARGPAPTDPADLSDHHHDCCDLGQCRDASALAPSAPEPTRLALVTRPFVPATPRRRRLGRSRRAGHRPRDPPKA